MTREEIRRECLRTQALARELYGFHLFLRRWWERDGRGFGRAPRVMLVFRHWIDGESKWLNRD